MREDFTPSDVVRFWAKVDRSGESDACWPWTASIHPEGYGRFRIWGETRRAHRCAWLLTHDAIEGGLQVLHRCDNRKCCNPSHLFLGTNTDNVADRQQKGRGIYARGEQQGLAKLTEDDVRSIRASHEQGMSTYEIARQYGVDHTTIRAVVRYKTWRHVA